MALTVCFDNVPLWGARLKLVGWCSRSPWWRPGWRCPQFATCHSDQHGLRPGGRSPRGGTGRRRDHQLYALAHGTTDTSPLRQRRDALFRTVCRSGRRGGACGDGTAIAAGEFHRQLRRALSGRHGTGRAAGDDARRPRPPGAVDRRGRSAVSRRRDGLPAGAGRSLAFSSISMRSRAARSGRSARADRRWRRRRMTENGKPLPTLRQVLSRVHFRVTLFAVGVAGPDGAAVRLRGAQHLCAAEPGADRANRRLQRRAGDRLSRRRRGATEPGAAAAVEGVAEITVTDGDGRTIVKLARGPSPRSCRSIASPRHCSCPIQRWRRSPIWARRSARSASAAMPGSSPAISAWGWPGALAAWC